MRLLLSDTETCGLNPPKPPASGVVEVAYLEIDSQTLGVKDEFCSRINPGCKIDPGASKIHGIHDEDVKDMPKLEDVYKVHGNVIHLGHNCQFDLKFLSHLYENLVGSLCTLQLARKYVLDSPNHKLGTLVDHLGLQKRQAHSALDDCYMTLDLLRWIVEKSGRTLDQHIAAARKPKIVVTMPFGKYKGVKINTLPRSYLEYFADKEVDADLRYSIDQALKIKI